MKWVSTNKGKFSTLFIAVWTVFFLGFYIGRKYDETSFGNIVMKKNKQIRVKITEIEVEEELKDPNEQPLPAEHDTDYEYRGHFSQDNLCIDSLGGKTGSPLGLYGCHGQFGNQLWSILGRSKAFKSGRLCMTGPIDLESEGVYLTLQNCNGTTNQAWTYIHEYINLVNSSLCIEANKKEKKLFTATCAGDNPSQIWKYKELPGFVS